MKKAINIFIRTLGTFGFNPIQMIQALKGIQFFLKDLNELKKQKSISDDIPLGTLYPCLSDRFSEGGTASGHYFHQDLLVARKIFMNRPVKHVDVGSRIDGFVAHVAAFRPIEVFDIRPISDRIPNISFKQADMMSKIPDVLMDYCDSLSCLHALEHFGLGRYGDPINYLGHLSGFENLYALLKQGGKFYFSVPIGPQRLEFNAHRVFSIGYLLGMFENKFRIDQFSFVDDAGNLHENIQMTDDAIRNNFHCNLGCGIFELTKI